MTTYKKIKNNQRLEKSAAESAERLFETDSALFVNSGYRSDAEQKDVFLRNMTLNAALSDGTGRTRTYNGKKYYVKKGYGLAAPPGYSNHRSGKVADFGPNLTSFSSTNYARLSKTAPYYGWNNAEGRATNEPWHWTYVQADDKSLARRGWYHVKAAQTNTYSVKTGKKTNSRKAGFDVYADHGILVSGAEWVVTNHGNRYRLSHLDKGKAPKYRTVYVTAEAGLRGRSTPDSKSTTNIKFVRPKGYKLVVRDVPGKPEWVVTRYNTYYWKEFTK